jgi:hypothetical protein
VHAEDRRSGCDRLHAIDNGGNGAVSIGHGG